MVFDNPAFFSWLLAASLSLAILWAVYECFFRNWTFFGFNRWILLGGTCACLLVPLISAQVAQQLNVPENTLRPFRLTIDPQPPLNASANAATANDDHAPDLRSLLWTIMALGYWAGVATMLLRSFKALTQLKTVRLKARLLRRDAVAKVWVQSLLPTFSFGKSIFLNVHTLSLDPVQQASIQRHEEAHVLQKHTADNLFFEIVSAIFWFNPFVGRLGRHLRDTHEFLADRWATHSRAHATDYQELLVALASNAASHRVSHPFSDSQFFRRIVMLNKPKTNAMESLKLFLLAPACAAAIFVSACVDSDQKTVTNPRGEVTQAVSGPVISNITWTGNTLHSADELNKLLGVKPGDRYDRALFEQMLFGSAADQSVVSIYMDNGYLFFSPEVKEKLVNGKMDLTIALFEGEQAWIDKVTLKDRDGGTLLTKKIQPFVEVKSGQLFNRSLFISSQEKIAKSGFVRSDKVEVNPSPKFARAKGERTLVDVEFVVQKP